MVSWGDANGQSREIMGQLYDQTAPKMFDAIHQDLFITGFRNDLERNRMLEINDALPMSVRNPNYYKTTSSGLNEMIDFARNWFGGNAGIQLAPARGPRGPSGPKKPTAQEIRNQFDIAQLTDEVNKMNQALVLEEHGDAKGLARKYVDAVVSTGGEKQIDFSTFVRSSIEKTSRFKSIYRNKPEHLSAEQHMAPYLQQASGFAAPDKAAEIAIGGAQFGASAQQFQERLKRTESFTSSAPFINSLEGRMSELNSIFKG
jgi:hypothetical protein